MTETLPWRIRIRDAADRLCAGTGHRLCRTYGRIDEWAWKHHSDGGYWTTGAVDESDDDD